MTIVIGLLVLILLLSGVALLFAGVKEQTQENTETKNMSQRFDRVSTAAAGAGALLAGTTGRSHDSLLDANREVDKEFAKEEEARAHVSRSRRKTTLLPSLSKYSEGYGWMAKMEDDLIQAKSPWRATELVAASFFITFFLIVMLLLNRWGFMALVALPALGFPWVYVKGKRAAYYRRFDDQLGDALMLMSNSLRAGFSFMQSMEMVGKEAPPPISDEFTRVTQEIAIGVPIGEALLSMSDRIKSMDLQLVVTAVIIQREVGGALAQLLELISGVIRERQTIKGEIRTLTAQGRLTGIILGLMPIFVAGGIYVVSKMANPLEPSFLDDLIYTSLGHLLLAGAVIWQMLGLFIIMRIVNIKV